MAKNPRRLLLVDDDAVCREDVHRLIGKSFTIVEAATGREALDNLESHEVQCALLDYRLPDLDGLKVLSGLIEAGVPVVMMTCRGSEQVAVNALKQGASDYLIKSALTEESLKTAIERAINLAALERKVRRQQQELKMFASVASHDLMAPLARIKFLLKGIKNDVESSKLDRVPEYCDRAIKTASRMNQLIENLLQYARIGRHDRSFQQVALNEVVDDVVSTLATTVQDLGAQIDVEDLPEVHGEPIGLYQLIQNLVANGLKFNKSHGTIRVRIYAMRTGRYWRIGVEDNGIGIDPKWKKEIFQPFRRLHAQHEYEGCGLGLATCMKIVEQHHGEIWLESRPGKGTTVLFTLPINENSDQGKDEPQRSNIRESA